MARSARAINRLATMNVATVTSKRDQHRNHQHAQKGDAVIDDKIELLDDADAGRDKQQGQVGEQAMAGGFDAAALQRPARQHGEAIARQQQQPTAASSR